MCLCEGIIERPESETIPSEYDFFWFFFFENLVDGPQSSLFAILKCPDYFFVRDSIVDAMTRMFDGGEGVVSISIGIFTQVTYKT